MLKPTPQFRDELFRQHVHQSHRDELEWEAIVKVTIDHIRRSRRFRVKHCLAANFLDSVSGFTENLQCSPQTRLTWTEALTDFVLFQPHFGRLVSRPYTCPPPIWWTAVSDINTPTINAKLPCEMLSDFCHVVNPAGMGVIKSVTTPPVNWATLFVSANPTVLSSVKLCSLFLSQFAFWTRSVWNQVKQDPHAQTMCLCDQRFQILGSSDIRTNCKVVKWCVNPGRVWRKPNRFNSELLQMRKQPSDVAVSVLNRRFVKCTVKHILRRIGKQFQAKCIVSVPNFRQQSSFVTLGNDEKLNAQFSSPTFVNSVLDTKPVRETGRGAWDAGRRERNVNDFGVDGVVLGFGVEGCGNADFLRRRMKGTPSAGAHVNAEARSLRNGNAQKVKRWAEQNGIL